jgi:hypothetical protein
MTSSPYRFDDPSGRWRVALNRASNRNEVDGLVRMLRQQNTEMTQEVRDLLADLLEQKQLKNRKRGRYVPIFPLIEPATKKALFELAEREVKRLRFGQPEPLGDFDLFWEEAVEHPHMSRKQAIAQVAGGKGLVVGRLRITADELTRHMDRHIGSGKGSKKKPTSGAKKIK